MSLTREDRAARYVEAALERACGEAASAGDHDRNNTLNAVAYSLGRLIGGGLLGYEQAHDRLLDAALSSGLERTRALATLKSGLRAGVASPRVPEGLDGHCAPRARQQARKRPQAPAAAPPPRPPAIRVKQMWGAARPVLDDPEVAGYLRSRAIDPERVELHDLARALPEDATMRKWSWGPGGPWRKHHRLIIRAWGATGHLESLHARDVTNALPPEMKNAKALWPAKASSKGLVMACPLGQLLLQGKVPSWWKRRKVVIAEGATDFLTWGCNFSDADLDAPVVFGFTSGGWCQDIANRIPLDARVIIAADPDDAGDKYVAEIAPTLTKREVVRWTPTM